MSDRRSTRLTRQPYHFDRDRLLSAYASLDHDRGVAAGAANGYFPDETLATIATSAIAFAIGQGALTIPQDIEIDVCDTSKGVLIIVADDIFGPDAPHGEPRRITNLGMDDRDLDAPMDHQRDAEWHVRLTVSVVEKAKALTLSLRQLQLAEEIAEQAIESHRCL
jgi:hypothetical protein